MDEATQVAVLTRVDGHLEGVDREIAAQARRDLPTNDHPAEHVGDECVALVLEGEPVGGHGRDGPRLARRVRRRIKRLGGRTRRPRRRGCWEPGGPGERSLAAVAPLACPRRPVAIRRSIARGRGCGDGAGRRGHDGPKGPHVVGCSRN